MEEDLTVKEVLIANNIVLLQEKLIGIIEDKKIEFAKIVDYKGQINLMCLTAAFNVLTTIVASDIGNEVFEKGLIQSLIEDFKIEVVRKLQDFKKQQLEES